MATIIEEGCIVSCKHCCTKFSFGLREVSVGFTKVAAGYSPEEEAYEKPKFSVACPKCSRAVDVESALGSEGKASAVASKRDSLKYEDYDL